MVYKSSLYEGRKSDAVRNFLGKAKNTYDYYKGDRDSLYSFKTKASESDLKKTDFAPFIKNHLGSYEAKKDVTNNKIKIDFDTTQVSKEFAKKCKPGSKEGLAKYITGYKDGVATMILPMSGKEEESLELDVDADESMMTPVQVKKRYSQCDSNGKLIKEDFYEDDNFDNYEEIGHKYVYDFDGFTTDYTMYRNLDTGMYVMIFGDRDIYSPNNTEPDAEFETREEADEWFDSYEGFVDDEDDYNEESLTLETEDYWFGGDGKTASDSSATEKTFNYTDTPDLRLDLDTNDEEWKDEETESLTLDETPGLTLSTPEVNSQGILEIEINGKKYRYTCDNPDMSSQEVADKVTKMKKYSDGKALAYLKKNMKLVTESVSSEISKGKWAVLTRKERKVDPDTYFIIHIDSFDGKRSVGGFTPNGYLIEYDISKIKYVCDSESEAQKWIDKKQINESVIVSEKFDGSVKDQIKTDIINAFYSTAKNEEFGFESNDEIDDYLSPVFVVEDYNDDQIRVEVRLEGDFETMGLMAEELNPVVQQYDPNAYFDFVDTGIMEAIVDLNLKEEIFNYDDEDEDRDQVINDVFDEVSYMYGGDLTSEDAIEEIEASLKDRGVVLDADDLGNRISRRNMITVKRESLDLDTDESPNEYHIIEDAIKEVYMMYGDFEKDAVEEIKRMIKEKDIEISDSDLDDKISEFKRYNIVESNSFKQHHVCQTCGNTLDKCTCKAEGEEEDEKEECVVKEDFSGATQVSNVGQYKRSSIDMTSEEDKENKEDA